MKKNRARPSLIDLLTRRGITLANWMVHESLTTFIDVSAACMRLGVAPPMQSDVDYVVGQRATAAVTTAVDENSKNSIGDITIPVFRVSLDGQSHERGRHKGRRRSQTDETNSVETSVVIDSELQQVAGSVQQQETETVLGRLLDD